MKKKLISTALAVLFLAPAAWSTPPLRKLFTVRQSDGSTLTVRKQGNGRFGYLVTTDGLALLCNAAGDVCYAELAGDSLRPTAVLAHDVALRSQTEQQFAGENAVSSQLAYATLSQKMTSLRPQPGIEVKGAASTADGLGQYGQSSGAVVNSIGSPAIPVIMVEFPDREFQATTTQEKVSRLFNEAGYADEPYCVGSVADYFADQSNGLFTPRFDVVAKVKASHGYAYYGANGTYSTDLRVSELISEAVQLAQQAGTDFSRYAEADGIPLVTIYYAGPGEHSAFETGCEDYLWAHFAEISGVSADGIPVNSYFVGNEILQSYDVQGGRYVVTGSALDGIGVFCHEFGHALGLPDFYAVSGNENCHTPDYWSVMDYGQYWADGYAPIGYTAYERSFMGWLDVTELGDEAGSRSLYPFGSQEGATAYVLRNPGNEKEYYLLENRQAGKWYPEGLGHGMLITHVNYSSRLWNMNTVNDSPNSQHFAVVPADNEWQSVLTMTSANEFRGDLYPGFTTNTEFSDESTPAATLYSGGRLGKPLYNIAESDAGVISFDYLERGSASISSATQSSVSGPVVVYAIDGRRVASAASWDAARRLLAPGTYVVKGQGGATRKVSLQ